MGDVQRGQYVKQTGAPFSTGKGTLVQVLREERHPQGSQCNAYDVAQLPVQHKAGCHGWMIAMHSNTHQQCLRGVGIQPTRALPRVADA